MNVDSGGGAARSASGDGIHVVTRASALAGVLIGVACAGAQPVGMNQKWPTLCGANERSAARAMPVPSMAAPRWVLGQTAGGSDIRFVGPAGVVASYLRATAPPMIPGTETVAPGVRSRPSAGAPSSAGRIRAGVPLLFASATIDGDSRALAIDARSGALVWNSHIPGFMFDSWSAPAVDAAGGVVLFASGSSLTALRMSDGSRAWQAEVASFVVNASAAVTDDLGPANRAFIVDDGGFGGPSFLYCVNVSARDALLNPFDPGEVVWAAPCGSSSGATPAYRDGVVYVTSTGLELFGHGEIRAFDATASSEPAPLWTFTNPEPTSFFGGVTIRETPEGTYLYGATYAFSGGLDSSSLVKLNASDGSLRWSVPCNRTASIPVVLPDGRVVLSTGVQGFGSVPTVQMFADHGNSASLTWDSAVWTWSDANANGSIDLGEFLVLGGWTTHPALAIGPGGSLRLLVGEIPTDDDYAGAYRRLYEIDLSKSPGDAGFIVQSHAAGGSTPALFGGGVYSVGVNGLAAFGPTPP